MRTRNLAVLIALCCAISGALGVLGHRVFAVGIPAANTLTYTGVLEDANGVALAGSRNIQLQLWDAASGGTIQCATSSTPVTLVGGRFQIPLADACATAVKGHPDLWVEALVDGASLGRTKLGAVPYALEAQQAQEAGSAIAGGSLDQRIAKLEGVGSGKVAGIWYYSPPNPDCVTINTNVPWTDMTGTAVTFNVSSPVTIWATYAVGLQPDSSPGAEFVATRMVVDNVPIDSTASQYQPYSGGDSNTNMVGTYVADLASGSHAIKLQWMTSPNGGGLTWSSCLWSGVSTRTIAVMAVYK
jgi:hypothetical protein